MKTRIFAFVSFVVLSLGCNSALANSITWTNTSGGNWNAAANWSPNQVPASTDDAYVTNNGSYTVTLNASATVGSLTVGGASGTQSLVANANTLTLNRASTVGSNGVFNLGGGTLSGAGSFSVNGPFNWSSGTINNTGGVTLNGTSSLSGVGTFVMQLYGLLINAGTLTWGGSGQNLYINGGTLTNLATGTINITADVSSVAGGTIGNAGVLRKTGGAGTTTLGTALINNGDVQVQSGTLDLASGGSASGTFEVSPDTTLQFGGSYTLSSPSSVTGGGTVLMSSGTVSLSGAFSLSGTNIISSTLAVNSPAIMTVSNLNLVGGVLNGNAPVVVNGPFNWSSGTINNTGGVVLNGASSLSGVGTFVMQLYGLLINAGTLTWGGSGQNLYINGGTLTNLATGTTTITADVSSVAGGTIGNAGLLRKTGTTGTTTLGTALINNGDVQVQSGALDLVSGGSASGTFEVSANATLQFGGSYTLSSPSSVTGGGTVLMTSGTVSLSGAFSLSGTNIITGTLAVNSPAVMAVGNLNLSGGVLNGNAPVVVNGPFNWSTGTINNTGGIVLNGTSSLSGVGTYVMQLYGLLINAGTLTWGGSGQNLYIGGGALTNLATGTMSITADVASVAGGTIGNAGVLRKTGSTGTATLGTVLVNSGDVQVQSGTLDLISGGSASGTFEVSANATLQFGNSYTLSGASSVTGAGNAIFSSGTINASGTYNLTGTSTFSGATITFGGNYTLSGQAVTLSAGTVNFNAGGTVNLTGLTMSGGTLGGSVPVVVNGPFSWSSGSIYNTGGVTLNGASSLSGAGTYVMQLYGLLINAGALTWGGSGQNLYISGGTLTNLATGTLSITADVASVAGGMIGNAGVLRKTGSTGTTTLGTVLVNSGDVQVQSGTLDLTSGGSASGTFEVSANATLQFGNSYTLSGASSVTGAGNAIFSSGTISASGTYNLTGTSTFSGSTVTFAGNYTLSGQAVTLSAGTVNFNAGGTVSLTGLTLSGGTLGGTVPVVVNGPFSWSSGSINNTGGVTLNGTSSLSGVGTYVMQLYGLLVNGGTLTWGGSGQNLYISGGTLTNLATGTMSITADVASVAGGTIGNAGVLRKTGSPGATTLGTVLVNSGDVQVQSGTLDLASGGSASGTFEVSANATLQFGNSYTLSGASSVTGAGNAIFSSGTINASGTYNLAGTNTFSGSTVTFAGNYTLSGQPVTLSAGTANFNAGGTVNLTGLTLSGGTLGGTVPVTVNGPFSWSSGSINNTGGVALNGTSSLSGVGTYSHAVIRAVDQCWSPDLGRERSKPVYRRRHAHQSGDGHDQHHGRCFQCRRRHDWQRGDVAQDRGHRHHHVERGVGQPWECAGAERHAQCDGPI